MMEGYGPIAGGRGDEEIASTIQATGVTGPRSCLRVEKNVIAEADQGGWKIQSPIAAR